MTDSNGPDGYRDERGRFRRGNPGGPGNPNVTRLAQWRGALEAVMTPERLRKVFSRLLQAAEDGEPWAVREVLDRTMGKPGQADLIERVNRLEVLQKNREGGKQ